MLMNASGHLQVTVVDGTTLTGIFAADGSLNVYDATNETGFVGLQHPCGAINCVSSSGTTLTGAQAPNGAYYVVNDSAEIGLRHSSGGLCVTNFTVSEAVSFLSTWGPYGMVMDFTDASIAIKEASGVLDFTSQGQISNGALVGPGAKTTYSAPSVKLTEQEDGFLKFQAHNLCRNSEDLTGAAWTIPSGGTRTATTIEDTSSGAFQNVRQDITTISGATYLASFLVLKDAVPASTRFCAFNIAGSATLTAHLDTSTGVIRNVPTRLFTDVSSVSEGDSWRVTLAWTADSTNASFQIYPAVGSAADVSVTTTASQSATPTGSISVTKFHVRRTPSVDTYIATTSAAAYDLPYVYSGGDLQGIMVEAPATNLMPVATPSSGHSNITWAGNTLETLDPAGTNTASKMTTTATAGTNIVDSATVAATSCTASVYIKATASGLNRFALRNATTSTILLDITISDFSTGSFSYNTGSAGASVEVLNNGWLRVVLSASAGITSGNSIQFYTGALGNSVAAGQVLYIWCRQLETGTVATSPIITYGAAVARAADNIFMPTSSFPYSASEVLLYAELITPQGGFLANSTSVALNLNGSGAAGRSAYIQAGTTASNVGWFSGTQGKNWGTTPGASSVQKIAGTFNTVGTLAAATNQGQAVATSSISAWDGTGTRLQIGAIDAFGLQSAKAGIRRIMVLPVYDTAKATAVTA